MTVYQIFHDEESAKSVSEGKYIKPLCVQPGVNIRQSAEALGAVAYSTNQLSEARAFYHAILSADLPDYIGFTNYSHDTKFTFDNFAPSFVKSAWITLFPGDCIRLANLTPELADQAFSDPQTKVIAFCAEQNFLNRADENHPGMKDFLLSWLKEEYGAGPETIKKIERLQSIKFVPFCNSFIMQRDEFKKFFVFLDRFIKSNGKKFGINEFPFKMKINRRYVGRQWGLFIERLAGLYLIFNYGDDFNVAFIARNNKIRRLKGDSYLFFRKYYLPVLSRRQMKKNRRVYFKQQEDRQKDEKRIQRRKRLLHQILTLLSEKTADFFFIQIGSCEGVVNDPIYEYVKKYRWSGISVEPVKYLFDRLVENYAGFKNIHFENVAIADRDGNAEFYYLRQTTDPQPWFYSQLGSFLPGIILKHKQDLPDIEKYMIKETVPTLSFATLLQKYGVGKIDLLQIDAEGYDYEILKTVSFGKLKPKMIFFENKHLSPPDYLSCKKFFREKKYILMEIQENTFAFSMNNISEFIFQYARSFFKWRGTAGL